MGVGRVRSLECLPQDGAPHGLLAYPALQVPSQAALLEALADVGLGAPYSSCGLA